MYCAHDFRSWFKRACAKLLQWSAIEIRAAVGADNRSHPVRGVVSRREKLWLAAVLLAAAGWIIFRLLLTLLTRD